MRNIHDALSPQDPLTILILEGHVSGVCKTKKDKLPKMCPLNL